MTLAQATGHCPGSIFDEPADGSSAVQSVPETSTPVTSAGRGDGATVIHRSYPQAAEFHVKHDVERGHALWIQRWMTPQPSELFHVKPGLGGFFQHLCAQAVDTATHRSRRSEPTTRTGRLLREAGLHAERLDLTTRLVSRGTRPAERISRRVSAIASGNPPCDLAGLAFGSGRYSGSPTPSPRLCFT